MATRKPTSKSLEVFDLSAARAQRYEGKADHFSFSDDEHTYTLPFELKSSALKKLNSLEKTDSEGILKVFLGEKQTEQFLATDPSAQDISDVMEAYQAAAGITVPKGSDSND